MSKRLLTVAIAASVVCAFATTASATQSRLNALGAGSLAGFSKNITILDDRNIFSLPAELVKYGSWSALEVDGPGHTSFGIHYNLNATTVLALYGTSEAQSAITLGTSPVLSKAGSTLQGGGNSAVDAGLGGLTHKGTMVLGLDLGATRLGFLLGVHADSTKTFDDGGGINTNQGPMVIHFGAGVGFAAGNGDLDMGLNIRFGAPTHEDAEGAVSENSQFDVNILARGTFAFHGNHELVPYLDILFQSANGQLKVQDADQHAGVNFGMAVGTDIRLNLADGIFVQPGIGLAFQNYQHTTTNGDGIPNVQTDRNIVAPYYNVAVEVLCWEWMSLRFGGGQSVVFNSYTSETDGVNDSADTSDSEVEHHIATGVGFHLPHNVNIDIQVDTGWWKRGPYLITGDQGTFGMNAAISKDW